MTHFRHLHLWFLMILMVIFTSCVKDTIDLSKISKKIDWNPVFGFPISYGDISLKDFVGIMDTLGVIKAYPKDSLLYLLYKQNILSQSAADLLTIPEQNYQESFKGVDIDFPPLPIPFTDSIHFTRNINYTFGFSRNEEIDSVQVKTGTMNFNIQSGFLHTGWIKITLPTLKRNGKPIQQYIPITKADGTFSVNIPINIDNTSLVLTTTNGVHNQIPYIFEVVIYNKNGQPILINQQISAGIKIQNLKFGALYGYIGNFQLLDTKNHFSFNIFKNLNNINFAFKNPRLNLRFSNSFGLPVALQLLNTFAITNDNSSYPLTFSTDVNPKDIGYPNINNFREVKDSLIIDNSTSNFSQTLLHSPIFLNYEISATANPHGKTLNYVKDTSKLNIDFEIELPMDFKTTNYVQRDTMSFDMSTIGDVAIIKHLLIHSDFTNLIPFDLNVQIIFIDSKANHLDSLYTNDQQPLIASALVDFNGKVNQAVEKKTDVIFATDRINKIKNAKKAIVRAILTTAENGTKSVKFYSYSKLKVSLGILTELQVDYTNQIK